MNKVQVSYMMTWKRVHAHQFVHSSYVLAANNQISMTTQIPWPFPYFWPFSWLFTHLGQIPWHFQVSRNSSKSGNPVLRIDMALVSSLYITLLHPVQHDTGLFLGRCTILPRMEMTGDSRAVNTVAMHYVCFTGYEVHHNNNGNYQYQPLINTNFDYAKLRKLEE